MKLRNLRASGGHLVHAVNTEGDLVGVAVCGFKVSGSRGGWYGAHPAFSDEPSCPHCRKKLDLPVRSPQAMREEYFARNPR